MYTFIYSLLFLLYLFLIAFVLRMGVFRTLNFFSFNLAVFLVFSFISSLLIIFGLFDGFYYLIPIQEKKDVILLGAIFHLWASLGILITLIVMDGVFNKFKIVREGFYSGSSRIPVSVAALFFVLFFISSLIYLYQSYPSYLVMLIKGAGSIEISHRRLELTSGYEGIGLVKTLSINLSLLLFFLFGYYSSVKVRFYYFVFLLFTFVSIAILTVTGEKFYLVAPFLFFIFGRYSHLNKLPPLKYVFFIFLISLFLYFAQFGFGLEIFKNFISRLFLAQSVAVYLSVDQVFQGSEFFYFNSHRSSLVQFVLGIENPVDLISSQFVDLYY